MPPQSFVARSETEKRNEREKRGQNQTGNHPNNFCYSPNRNGSGNDRFLTIISKGGLACSNWLPESFDQALCHRRPRRAKDRSPGSVFPTKILRRARKKPSTCSGYSGLYVWSNSVMLRLVASVSGWSLPSDFSLPASARRNSSNASSSFPCIQNTFAI